MSLKKPTIDEETILPQLYAIFKLKENYYNDVRLMKVYKFVKPIAADHSFDAVRNLERLFHEFRHEDTFERVYQLAEAVVLSKYDTALSPPKKHFKNYLDY